ncbi:MAG: hypothetical protein KDI74_07930 [Gammaproteobacteria bacterium]|nr:hypothetical protein [Gammaproteobacteria bacterium]
MKNIHLRGARQLPQKRPGPVRRFVAGALAAALCVSSLQISAAVSLTQWGATALTYSLNFSELTQAPGESVGGSQQAAATIGSASAGSTTGLLGRGSAGASVEIPATGVSLPVLRARAESTMDDLFVSGAALGLQAYQFTGADATTLSLDVNLEGTVARSAESSDLTGLEVSVWIMSANAPVVFPAEPVTVTELVAQIIAEAISDPTGPFNPIITKLSWDAASTGTGIINRNGTLDFLLNNGDEFYLMAALSAGADGVGASALSWSTLTMAFDTTALQAASTVPLPPGVWLFATGLLGLLGAAKRRKA